MGLIWPLVGIVAGALIAVQAPINAQLAEILGLRIAATAVSFVSGGILMLALTFATAGIEGVTIDWRAPPYWLLVTGGLLGAGYVTSVILLTPKLGIATTMSFVVAGQLLAGLMLDRLGLFGLAVHEISFGRVAGAVLLLAGALLVRFA
jgi:transporter family-2 protein